MAKKGKKTPLLEVEVDDGWRARSDLDTIERAAEVLGDSSRMKAAKAFAEKQKASIDRVARLENVNLTKMERMGTRPKAKGTGKPEAKAKGKHPASSARLTPQKESHPPPIRDRVRAPKAVDQSKTGKLI